MRLNVLTVARDAGPGVGGTEVLVEEIVRRLDPQRFEQVLCTTRAPAPGREPVVAAMEAELHERGVATYCLERRRTSAVLPFARLPLIMRRHRIDVVHAHMPRASMPASLAARLSGVPVVISHEHGSVLGPGKRTRRLVDRHIVARLSDTILAVSEFDRQNLIAHEGIAPERIRVLRNGSTPLPVSAPIRTELAPPGVPLVVAVGRLAAVKGYDVLIRAAAALRDEGRAVRVAIAGDGPERGALSELIASLGLEREATLLGLRADVGDILAAADVVVMSSHSEGAPLAILEYMAAGTPIVATNVGGIPELIDDGVHGLLVAPGDPAALAAGVARILDDRRLADRLAGAARIRRSTEFDLAVMVERLQLLYEELFAAAAGERVGHAEWSPATA